MFRLRNLLSLFSMRRREKRAKKIEEFSRVLQEKFGQDRGYIFPCQVLKIFDHGRYTGITVCIPGAVSASDIKGVSFEVLRTDNIRRCPGGLKIA